MLRVVPDPVLVTVGVEDHPAAAVHLFQGVGPELRLLLPLWPRAAGALRLDHRNGQAVGAPEGVVGDAVTLLVRHRLHPVFQIPALLQVGPSGLGQQEVDQAQAGRSLVVVVRIGGLIGAGLGDLRALRLQLLVEARISRPQVFQFLVALLKGLLGALDAPAGLADQVEPGRQRGRVELFGSGGFWRRA